MIGAYAGEIGQTQFLPSSYIKYGVDFDGDGRVDLRHSVADVLRLHRQSAAHQRASRWARRLQRGIGEFRGDARVESRRHLPQDHRLFCRSARGAVNSYPSPLRGGGWPTEGQLQVGDSYTPPWLASLAFPPRNVEGYDLARRRCVAPQLIPPHRQLLDPLCHHAPIGRGAEALQDVHEAGVAADQDARLVLLDALDDPKRRILRRGLGDDVEALRSICTRRSF